MLQAGSLAPLRFYLDRLRSSLVAQNSAYMMGSQVSSVVLQTVQFLLLARALGSHEFGIVASVLAITSALLPFSGLCLGNVAVIRMARGQAGAERCLGNGLAVTTVTAVIGLALALLLGSLFLAEPGVWLLVLLFGLSEFLLTKYIDISAHVFMAREQHGVAAYLLNFHLLVRLAFAAALWLGWTQPTALAWAQLHLAAGVLTAALVLYATVRLVGRPRVDAATAIGDMKAGVLIAIGTAAGNVQTDVDKVVLARMESAGTAGAYTAACRLVYMASMPVLAILLALRTRIFRKGHHGGIAGALGTVRGVIPLAGGYCMLVGVGLYLAGPAMPWVLGPSYQLSGEVLQWLCLLPLLLAARSVCSEALAGADQYGRLSLLYTATAGLSLLLNLAFVPAYGWRGAVMAAYGAQAFLVAALLVTIGLMIRAEREARR